MIYSVKEIFYTLQGEGANSGRPAVFCRFAGCNLWSGREQDRDTAVCQFCDTEFVGVDGLNGGKFGSPDALVQRIDSLWPWSAAARPMVVFTGGEPLLQLDEALIDKVHQAGFEVAVETNGTIVAPPDIDWLCVSPKADAVWIQRAGNELKLVWPQSGIDLEAVEQLQFDHRFLQPMDGSARAENTRLCVEQCLARPAWRLSLQTHKIIGIR